MIIAISGKIGSGKDTVGKIIQYLTHEYEMHGQVMQSYEGFLALKYDESAFNWKIKKFADKLKDIVCLLTGCTREQLEDQEFKNIELGEEWWGYTITLGSKRILNTIAYGSKPEKSIYEYNLVKLTPRLLLQLLGTDCGRNIIHPNIWVNALFTDYYCSCGHKIPSENGISHVEFGTCKEPNWIITDMRFPNEMEAVKNRGGITIRVNRDLYHIGGGNYISKNEFINTPSVINNKNYSIEELLKANKKINNNEHPSETSLDNAEFDYVIENNGTIEELIEKVKEILIKEKII